jgi:hypothetical protein
MEMLIVESKKSGEVVLTERFAKQIGEKSDRFVIKRSELRNALNNKGLPDILDWEYKKNADDFVNWDTKPTPIFGTETSCIHLYEFQGGKLTFVLDDHFIRVNVSKTLSGFLHIGCVIFEPTEAKKVIKWAKSGNSFKARRKKKLTRKK